MTTNCQRHEHGRRRGRLDRVTATTRETAVEVVTRTTTETTLTCDGPTCAESWVVPQFPQSPPWLVVTRVNNPLWDGGLHPDREVKHFHDMLCLRAWSKTAQHIWET